jgi:hypothetical protein
MNPLIMERDEVPESLSVVVINGVDPKKVESEQPMSEITLSERLSETRLSESEKNRMDWLSILWQTAVLTVTGVAVCLVFNYIS